MEHPKPELMYKVERQGRYNSGVDDCLYCGAHIDIWGKDAIGLCESGHQAPPYGIVYRCPVCLEIQWCHSNAAIYNAFCHYHRNNRYLARKLHKEKT